MDRGTEGKVIDVAQNLVCHLKKGYTVVKCRGQQDIQDQLSLAEALEREKVFFEDHPHFRYPGRVSARASLNLGSPPLLGKVATMQKQTLGVDVGVCLCIASAHGICPEERKRH